MYLRKAGARMRCECGEQTTSVCGDYLFIESGLNNVTLRGIELLKCDACGSSTPILSKINNLMQVIASALVLKPSQLTGKEIRFLRKYIGFTGEQFGKKLGLTKEHVSRIENERYPVGAQTDRLIRFLAVSASSNLENEMERLVTLLESIKDEPTQERIEINLATGSFEYAAA
jgi:transcriptional regulator with XRE-family HTH domain